LLDEFAFGDQAPQMLLSGLNRLETEMLLYLPHRGRETFEKTLTDEAVYEFPGLAGWSFG
jgi:hypothetical protein